MIVNGGTSRYGTGPQRLAERGTAAHSTVQFDGADSSEVWGGFRVARRARPFDVRVAYDAADIPPGAGADSPRWNEAGVNGDPGELGNPVEDGVAGGTAQRPVQEVTAAHDGYRRLPGRPVHRRTWRLTPDHFSVVDTLEGGYGAAVARFHLHPAIGIGGLDNGKPVEPLEAVAPHEPHGPVAPVERHEQHDPLEPHDPHESLAPLPMPPGGVLLLPGGQRARWQVTGGRVRLVPAHWHPEFGLSVASRCLEVEMEQGVCRLDLGWAAGA